MIIQFCHSFSNKIETSWLFQTAHRERRRGKRKTWKHVSANTYTISHRLSFLIVQKYLFNECWLLFTFLRRSAVFISSLFFCSLIWSQEVIHPKLLASYSLLHSMSAVQSHSLCCTKEQKKCWKSQIQLYGIYSGATIVMDATQGTSSKISFISLNGNSNDTERR